MKQIKATVIRDPAICREIIEEVKRKPSEEAIKRNNEAIKLLAEMRRK